MPFFLDPGTNEFFVYIVCCYANHRNGRKDNVLGTLLGPVNPRGGGGGAEESLYGYPPQSFRSTAGGGGYVH